MRHVPARIARTLILSALLALGVICAVPPSAAAQEGNPIQDVIRDQLDAFAADDYAGAFDHASPAIRDLFGTPDRFGAMVRRGYPMVHRPGEVTFLGRDSLGSAERQRVRIRDRTGGTHLLEYEMIRVDGVWRINGVRRLDDPAVGV